MYDKWNEISNKSLIFNPFLVLLLSFISQIMLTTLQCDTFYWSLSNAEFEFIFSLCPFCLRHFDFLEKCHKISICLFSWKLLETKYLLHNTHTLHTYIAHKHANIALTFACAFVLFSFVFVCQSIRHWKLTQKSREMRLCRLPKTKQNLEKVLNSLNFQNTNGINLYCTSIWDVVLLCAFHLLRFEYIFSHMQNIQ